MQYRAFGRTGAMVSVLGFGAMRLPMEEERAVAILRHGMDLGINYIDTALYYMDGQSEVLVGKAIKGRRDQVYLATKNPIENASGADWRRRLETSLGKLDTDYIDFYHMWAIGWDQYTQKIAVPGGPLSEARRAQSEGLIRHLCFSFHDTPENLIKLIDTEEFEAMLVQYNLLDRSNEAGMAYAHSKGMGVAVMGPVGGGRLGAPSLAIQDLLPGKTQTTAELALRFVLANPHLSVALSGMSSLEMVEENAHIASKTQPLSQKEKDQVQEALEQIKRLADLYCTGCNYCMPCPHGVDIPTNFVLMNYHRVYQLTGYAQNYYSGMEQKKQAGACLACGQCEPKCPQRIPIIKQLQETAEILKK